MKYLIKFSICALAIIIPFSSYALTLKGTLDVHEICEKCFVTIFKDGQIPSEFTGNPFSLKYDSGITTTFRVGVAKKLTSNDIAVCTCTFTVTTTTDGKTVIKAENSSEATCPGPNEEAWVSATCKVNDQTIAQSSDKSFEPTFTVIVNKK